MKIKIDKKLILEMFDVGEIISNSDIDLSNNRFVSKDAVDTKHLGGLFDKSTRDTYEITKGTTSDIGLSEKGKDVRNGLIAGGALGVGALGGIQAFRNRNKG